MKEFDKVINGELVLDKIEFKRVLCRKVIKSNDRGSKISIPKELNLEGKYVYIIVPKGKY
mgnify:CR=1 FL=1